jgi:hypothetical protein
MKYKPKLTINTKEITEGEIFKSFYNEITNEKTGYSITPTTFKGRNFFKSPDEAIFTEEYGFKENSVTRFGINIHNEGFSEQLKKELVEHNEILKKEVEKDNETKSITNISGIEKYKTFSKHIQLTKCENHILQEAIKYMNTEKQKVVLVDTFPRETSQDKGTKATAGRIDLKKLDIHTVLLYKVDEGKILAIDPNNPMFSTHLNKYEGIETLCSTDEKYKIYSSPKDSMKGFALDKYRDCIDIAVKLAFVLSKNPYKSLDEIMKSKFVEFVTNNSKIDKLAFKESELIRKKQSSDIEKIIECYQEMLKISTLETVKREMAFKEYEEKITTIKNDYSLTLSKIDEEHLVNVVGLTDYNPCNES